MCATACRIGRTPRHARRVRTLIGHATLEPAHQPPVRVGSFFNIGISKSTLRTRARQPGVALSISQCAMRLLKNRKSLQILAKNRLAMASKGRSTLPRILSVPDGKVRVVSTTTTLKLAERMLAASRVVSSHLPAGFSPPTPMNLLLELFIAEENALYPGAADLGRHDGMSPRLVDRWLIALLHEGLIEKTMKR